MLKLQELPSLKPNLSLPDVFVFSPTSTNVTVMFSTGAGVEVRLREGTMTITVLLPEEFKYSTLGLLGNMNGDASDNLVLSNGQLVENHTNPEELFNFGASCKKLLTMQIMCCCSKFTWCLCLVVNLLLYMSCICYIPNKTLHRHCDIDYSCGYKSH